MNKKEYLKIRDWLVNKLEWVVEAQWEKDTEDGMFHFYGGQMSLLNELINELMRIKKED